MPNALRWTLVAAAWLSAAPLALAIDPREDADDSTGATTNLLRPGDVQFGHDLQGPPTDRDFAIVVGKARHSYEVRTSSLFWEATCTGPVCECVEPVCGANLDRVDSAGTILTRSERSNEDPARGAGSIGRTTRWIASADSTDFVRVLAVGGMSTQVYDVAFADTTLFLPRWNASATQSTYLFLQSTTNVPVSGFVYFHDEAGVLLASEPVSVPRHGLQVIATTSIAALAGRSGSATIAQLGGYGALVGKAVALEPGTGFTFDTPLVPVAR
jgi:hypothetical protein